MSERDDGEARGHVEARGHASGDGQVYQSGADQYVTHIHVAEARSRTAHEARQRADALVHVLTRTVGELVARCQELEEEVRDARAEGRAEAQAEYAGKLRHVELRAEQASRMRHQAEEERARAEELLAEAQREGTRQHREGGRDRDAAPLRAPVVLSQERQDTEQFSEFLDRVRTELGAVREKLRTLGEEADGRDGARVVEGRRERQPGADERSAPVAVTVPPDDDGAPAGPGGSAPVPGPPRRLPIAGAWVLCALPPWIPMLTVTVVRAAEESDANQWAMVSFVLVAGLVGGCLFLLALACVVFVTLLCLDRDSEHRFTVPALLVCAAASLLLFVVAFKVPLGWPGPAGAWGRAIVSFAGVE
ncbi:tripartite tricarboxylate transporter TctB family protein [Streptomyces sp. NPDC057236]|uniref:tripartite tricarboxylate transporter TctB family protein n=1 Tax=Streptomyces sp. NPDC057236 TaxID=3346059 RepID=UPI00363B8C5A